MAVFNIIEGRKVLIFDVRNLYKIHILKALSHSGLLLENGDSLRVR